MDEILKWGVDIILQIQQYRTPLLDIIFNGITSIGDSIFYMVIIPFIFWCVDRRAASYLLILFYISYWSNAVMKNILMQPRPFDLNPQVKVGKAGGYGLPSGHAQGSFVFWTSLALLFKKKWFYVLSIVIILLIALSRLYLGLHFPTDIFGAWFLGGIIMILFFLLHRHVLNYLSKLSIRIKIPLLIIITSSLACIHVSMWTVYPMGIIAGFCIGLFLSENDSEIRFDVIWYKRLLRFIIGFAGLIIILFIMKNFFPGEKSPLFLYGIYIRYFIFGIWVSFLAPGLFKFLKI